MQFVTVAQAPSDFGEIKAEVKDGWTVADLFASFANTPQKELAKVGKLDEVYLNGVKVGMDAPVYPNVEIIVVGAIKGN